MNESVLVGLEASREEFVLNFSGHVVIFYKDGNQGVYEGGMSGHF